MLDERDVPPAIHAQLFANYTYCLPPGELFLAYPVPGRNNETRAGPARLQHRLVPADHAGAARRFLHRRERQEARHLDPAAAAAARRRSPGAKAQARALVAPQVAEIFERDPRPFFQAIFDFISPQTVFGRVALLGDAAFLARPHPGAGTTKCAMDAEHLADSIAALGLRGRACQIPAPARRVRRGHRAAGPDRRLLHLRSAQAARAAPQQGRELGGRRPDARPRGPERAGAADTGREPARRLAVRRLAEPRLERQLDRGHRRVKPDADHGEADQAGEGERNVDLRVGDQQQIAEPFVASR